MSPLAPLTPARLPAPNLPADAQPPANQPPAPDAHATPPPGRHDGWTPDRQRTFVEGIAGGDTVEQACRRVGLTVSSAYAFRRRANGAAFALAWDGARLLARETLADTLLTRALEGQEETITRADGSTVTRYRHDNRLATHMLHRLDRFADAASASAHGTAARLVAGEFDAFLDLLDTHAAPARAGLFLGTRLAPDTLGDEHTAHADLAPVLALARADRYLRTRAAHAADVDIADLDPANRAAWSAEQWTRAEAAGLVALAPAPARDETACEPPLPPLRPAASAPIDPADRPDPVWWCEHADAWRTRFPPPDDFFGEADGEWGDDDYARELTPDELEQLERPHHIRTAVRHVTEARLRDRWFADAARLDPSDEPDEPDTPVGLAPASAPAAVDAQPAASPATTPATDPIDAHATSPDARATDTYAATSHDACATDTHAATTVDARAADTRSVTSTDPRVTDTRAASADANANATVTRAVTTPDARATDFLAARSPDARASDTRAATSPDASATITRAATSPAARATDPHTAMSHDPSATGTPPATSPDHRATPSPDPPPARPSPRVGRVAEHLRIPPVMVASTARGSGYHGLQAT